MRRLWPALALLAACSDPSLPTAQRAAPVVYGEDDRLDVYAVEDEVWRARATRSAMVLVPPDRLVLDADAGTVTLNTNVYGEHFDLCEGEPFYEQLRLGRCSGTLVDTDLVLTAGHCVPNQARCDDRRFVFEWYLDAEGEVPTLTPADVYECAEIVRYVDGTRDGQRLDFAFIRLDRAPPMPYAPAPLRPDDEPMAEGAAVTLIGFPNGLPAKVAANGRVVNPRAGVRDFFEATLDAFGGNSGSGVYDAQGQLAGILVRGETDYQETDAGCDVVNVLDEDRTVDEGAEDVTYVARAVEDLCLQGFRGDRLCAPGDQTWCYPCVEDADCREGWTCGAFEQNQRIKFCRKPCEVDEDCRGDHACVEGGCAPRLGDACVGPDVWARDACRRNVAPVEACPADQRCAVEGGEGGCVPAPEGDRCGAPIEIEAVDQLIEGDLAEGGFGNYAVGTCAGNGPEVVYAFSLDRPRPFTAVATGFDTVLHLRRGCAELEVACVDDSDPPGDRGSRIQADLAPGDYRLFMDSFRSRGAEGYQLALVFGDSPCEPVACTPGEARCGEAGREVCANAEADGCPEWAPAPCADGTVCEAGECALQPDAALPDMAPDLGAEDAGEPDAAEPDAAEPDAAPLDQAVVDAARPDQQVPDAGAADASAPDGGAQAAGGGDGGCRAAPAPAPVVLVVALLFGIRRRRGTGW